MDGNGETTIFYVMIWNHPIETTIKNWLLGVPVIYMYIFIKRQRDTYIIIFYKCRVCHPSTTNPPKSVSTMTPLSPGV